jgi:predicted transcriptional regulator
MRNKLHTTTAKKANLRFAAPKRIENVEFAALMQEMRNFDFRPANVARMLNKSKAAVSQYLSGHTRPSNTVLELLRRIVSEKRLGNVDKNDEIEELKSKLKCLQFFAPSEYQIIKDNVEKIYAHTAPRIQFSTSANVKSKIPEIKVASIFHRDAIAFANEIFALNHPSSKKNPPKASGVRSEAKPSTKSKRH